MRTIYLLIAAICAAGAVAADPAEGTWLSPPDGKGQTGHVVMAPCGDALCGTLVRAFSPEGAEITTDNVGRQLLRNIKPVGGASYEGRAFVPVFGREFPAEVTLRGNSLVVKGCAAGLACRTQTWKRVD